MRHIDKAALWYFSKEALPYWSVLFIDCLLLLVADYFGAAVASGPSFVLRNIRNFFGTFMFYMIFYIIGFRIFHTYAGVFRFSSFVDLKRVGFAMLSGFVLSRVFQCVFNLSWLMHIRILAQIL